MTTIRKSLNYFVVLKKALAISLLFLFLFNALGYYVIFELNKFLIKKEMRSMAFGKPSAMTVLIVPDAENNGDLRRIDKHEILYKNRMYDIIREVKKGRCVTFYCIRDTREENLLAGFKKNSTNRFTLALMKNLVTAAIPPSPEETDFADFTGVYYYPLTTPICLISIPPIIPPPKC